MKALNEISYPVYRKYTNELSWFRVESPESFTEIRKMGARYLCSTHGVKILPDRNLIHDLVLDFDGFAVEIRAEEFENLYKLCPK